MKNAVIGIAAILVALVVLISAKNMLSGNSQNFAGNDDQINNAEVPVNTGNAPSINENGEQEVTLKYVNYKYEMYPSTLRKGIPVRLEVDLKTVTGCMVNVRIPSFNVAKTVRQGDNIITFTPDKSGTFQMACSMGMGRNTFTVVDDSGSVGTFVEQPAQIKGGSCGAGCGCGGGGA